MSMSNPLLISFWSRGEEEWRFLSNFAPSPIKYHGSVWPSAEHLYQAMKFESPIVREQIRCTLHPAEVKAIAKAHSSEVRATWPAVKSRAMKFILLEKFRQNPDLLGALLATGTAQLVHYAPWDSFWGTGKNNGENMLGRLLMEVREQLR